MWDFNSSKYHKTPGIPKFSSLEGAHPFYEEWGRELSPTPTQTFKLLQLTGQILIGNCNSINWGWWITGSVRKALKHGRLADGSRILLWSSGGKDNRKQRTGRGLALNPLVFLIQGWLNPKKALGMKVQQHQGDRDQIRDKLQPREHLGNRAWISWLEWENTWLQGNSIVWRFVRSGYNIQAPSGHWEFIKGYCSGIFWSVPGFSVGHGYCLSSLPTLMGIPSSALHSWSQHGTIPKPGFAAPWHRSCHAPWIPLIPLPMDPHSPGSP